MLLTAEAVKKKLCMLLGSVIWFHLILTINENCFSKRPYQYKVPRMYNVQSEHNYVYYEVLYNFQLHVLATLPGHHQVLYLGYRGLYYVTGVSNGRRDLFCIGQVHKLN